ncbi:MAG: WYL domain-containing protein, partial [Rhodococcus sp. (in: high G+C Gram-positive bacteria)]
GSATVWVVDDAAFEIRRLGTALEDRTVGGRSGSVVQIPVRSWEWVTRLVAGHGGDALVLDPPELRADVIRALRSAAVAASR